MQPRDIQLMRYILAIIWLATGTLSLGIHRADGCHPASHWDRGWRRSQVIR